MKNYYFVSLLLIPSLLLFSCMRNRVVELELNENWRFRKSNEVTWLNASVPGCVHTDLLKNDVIEDPYFGKNEQALQWIEKSNWDYRSTFFADDEILDNDKVELVFKGLDTYADVYLNDSLILSASNMFREWVIDCKEKLLIGKNELYIKFWSPVIIDSIKASELTYQLPDKRGFARKAPYQYGWDWGPRFVTSGIWRPVYLRCWNNFRIENVQVIQKELSEENGKISTIYEINAVQDGSVELIVLDDKSNQEFGKLIKEIKVGSNNITIDFFINDPELWWSNGLGKAHLYEFSFIAKSRGCIDEVKHKIGLRTLEFVQMPDSIGSSFHFELNGVPVFMKGANYIPQDNFPSRVIDDKYRQTIKAAVDANMNMLRVWGGGIYENEIFYDLCDEYGILVWQDFMFACNMYPGDEAFIENVKQEAVEQVKRLRNHPSLALWCGNNEIDEAWHNWGWQKALGYSKEDSLEVWNNYLKIFDGILPKTILTHSPYIPYIPSSPRIGWGHDEALTEGDMHYWGVWWGEEPFEAYDQKVGRFMSEYGFQGFPDLKTLDSVLNPSDFQLESEALINHQKHPRGMELIQTYMERDYHVPDSFEHYIYISQLVQANGIKTAIEAHRRAKPYCMGTLYWQLNDCWPVISWSSVDYYNNWKALHYFVRDAFKDFLISFEIKNDTLKVFIVSDKLQAVNAKLDLKIVSFDGEEHWTEKQVVDVAANSSSIYFMKEVTGFSIKDHLFIAKLISNEKILASNIYYFLPVKDLKLPEPNIQKEIVKTTDGYQIILKTDKLAKNVFLSIDGNGFFSDNYFDLLPGEEKRITFISKWVTDSFGKELKVISLVDTL